MNEAGHFVAREAFPDEAADLLRTHLGVRTHDDRNRDILAEALMRNGECHGVDHVGMAQDRVFDFGRSDLQPAALDDLLRSADDEHESVGVDVSEVDGAKPAVAKRVRRRRGVVLVSSRDGRTPQRDFTLLAGSEEAIAVAEDDDLGPGGAAHGA
jgi:hypothetical protein